ncbi:hypothetical protein Poli38472_001843 [Pythium oligandrum]|uniref:EF-hand domain-containing protein n=1 Tax=Pythium oligandrum TaxID=41045 RepID=A0A8K1CVI6_PYTOL|nr:hypothetical protein Poli38472_001843 [Pythium oligandrum]|eukprot:TMW69687.1 hypothetical protein Poli38472_001843 [Pythium oligandrum]
MLAQALPQDLEHEFLSIDAYLESTNNDEDLWCTSPSLDAQDDEECAIEHGDGEDGEEEVGATVTRGEALSGANKKQQPTPRPEQTQDAQDDRRDSMEMLDDGSWLDFDGQTVGSSLISPTLMRRLTAENDTDDLLNETDDDDPDGLLLCDDLDLPDITDADVAALIPTVTSAAFTSDSQSSSSSQASVAPLPSPSGFANTANAILVRDQDIPDMVNLFSSMYSPSEASRNRALAVNVAPPAQQTPQHQQPSAQSIAQSPLTIMLPAPQAYNSLFQPFASTPGQTAAPTAPLPAPTNPTQQFEYFTPPGVNATRLLDPNSIFLSTETLSPPTKTTSAAAIRVTQAQNQVQAAAVAAAAMAMASSAAAMNTMRKLNTTYGVPIAPLQRAMSTDVLPLKPKMATTSAAGTVAGATAASIAASYNNTSKVSKISITPDISDFKLVQIFHNFCDPMSKVLPLPRFHQLLQHHQIKEDTSSSASTAAQASANATSTQESQSLFKILDKKGAGFLDLETFMGSFQICNRCTEAKRRAHSAVCAAQGQSFVPTALERQLMEDVAPVVVRVVPTSFEGHKVKSCEHYQWTWCEGFEKTGNEKCKGTNRHDKCPKYLANCTLWKHKLPPKNRKSKILDNIESPSKKFKHFA